MGQKIIGVMNGYSVSPIQALPTLETALVWRIEIAIKSGAWCYYSRYRLIYVSTLSHLNQACYHINRPIFIADLILF